MVNEPNIPPAVYMMHRRQFMMAATGAALANFSGLRSAFADSTATAITPAKPLADLPRTAQLVLGWSFISPVGVTNPWAVPSYTHQEGNGLMWEPLMYFGIFKDDYIPWLATSVEYTAKDFTALEIKLNPLAKWSDGKAVTAKDVVFTFEGQMKYDKLLYHTTFVKFVESVTPLDDLTVNVKFKIPAPRFKFEVLCEKFDTGIPIVPAHAYDGHADANAYVGGVEIPHSGPYDLVAWDANQKIFNLREDWWAVGAGLISLPDVKRVIYSNLGGAIGQNMDLVAQRLVNNAMDSALDMRSSVIGNILAKNPKITTHSGTQSPYGYLDWWPNSLWMNTQIAPYNDSRVRRAISLAINRDVINDTLYEGAKIATIYPFPLYPGLQRFIDSPEMKALEAKLKPGLFDLDASTKLMTDAGFIKNGKELWEKDGQTINCTINGFEGIHSDIAPILVEFLLAAGFDAAVNFGTNAYQNMSDGAPGLYLFGHGASLKDPYATMELYHSRYSNAIGAQAGSNKFSRYKNPAFDTAVDAMAPLSSDDPKFHENAVKAMEIYWIEQIDVPIIQWLHRIAYNQTYWTNWPTKANLAMGANGAFWAQTGLLVVSALKKA